MAGSALALARELYRQDVTGDTKFFARHLYFFELIVPPSLADGSNSYVYPLVLAPQSIVMSEPFAVEATQTNRSGLFVEESGIVQRTLRISGTTGWWPKRPFQNMAQAASLPRKPSEGSGHGRDLSFPIGERLSGQRHLQFLQDAVFRTYSDLKRDPSTAAETTLIWHNPKDDEHWVVVPKSFQTPRTKDSQTYRYEIELLVVDKAAVGEHGASEDMPVINALIDGVRMVRFALGVVQGGIRDLSNIQGQLRTTLGTAARWVDDIAVIAREVELFVEGTNAVIQLPLSYIASTQSACEASLEAIHEAAVLGMGPEVPDSVLNTLRRINDGLNVLGSYPDRFRRSVDQAVDRFAALLQRGSDSARSDASTLAPATSYRDFEAQGTASRPGDFLRASTDLGFGALIPRYASAYEYVIAQGDTLASIASSLLGDARLWKILAVFNNLSAPFLSEAGLPKTLGIGGVLLIPSTARPLTARQSPAVLGASSSDPIAEQVLGVDLALVPFGDGRRYDLSIDVEGGSQDMRKVRGVNCLTQAVRSRLITDQGTDLLYRRVGVKRLVGLGLTAVDREMVRLRLTAALLADERLSAITRMDLTEPTSDALVIDVDAEVRGLNRATTITITPVVG